MSILSQVGMVLLVGAIVYILIRANKTLEEAAKEGEHFVDEWDMHQKRKEERLLERKTKKTGKVFLNSPENKDPLKTEEEITGESFSDEQQKENCGEEHREEESAHGKREYSQNNIVSMEQYKNLGITLVQLTEDHQTLRRIRVDRLPFTIGRSQDNMLVLDDLCVARKHCRIVEKEGAYVLEDVGSANKIFVHGQITEQVRLEDHLSLYIGNVEFVVEMSMSRSRDTHLYRREGERYYE